MVHVVIRPYNSPYFPWEAIAREMHYTNVYETVAIAEEAMISRYGDCVFTVKTI